MAAPIPYLTQASFCERVLTEQDGVLSAIRIIDTLHTEIVDSESAKGVVQSINLLICLRAGPFKGVGTLKIIALMPDGEPSRNSSAISVELKGGAHGANIVVNVGVELSKSGVYWYEVYFNDQLLTRTPLSVSVTEKKSELPKAKKVDQKKLRKNQT